MSDFELKTNCKLAPSEKLLLQTLPEAVLGKRLAKLKVEKEFEQAAKKLQRRLRTVVEKRKIKLDLEIKVKAAQKI